MRKLLLVFCLVGLSCSIISCGHMHEIEKPEQANLRPAEPGVQVGIGGKEVKAGDRLLVTKRSCVRRYKGRSGYRNECTYKPIGEAVVLSIIDEDSSMVQPDVGVTIDSSVRVEKKQE